MRTFEKNERETPSINAEDGGLFRQDFIIGIAHVGLSGALCFLAGVRKDIFASSYPAAFIALLVATWGLRTPEKRSFLNRFSTFFLFLGGILACVAALGRSHLSLGGFVFLWMLLFGTLVSGIRVFLSSFRVSLGFLLEHRPSEGPYTERERNGLLRKETAYLFLVVRPLVELSLFAGMAAVRWYLGPQFPLLSSRFGISAASLMPAAVLFPFSSLTWWFLTLDDSAKRAFTPLPLPMQIKGKHAVLSAVLMYVWGYLIQVRYGTGQLFAWTICTLVFAVLMVFVRTMSTRANIEVADFPDEPPASASHRSLVGPYILVLFLCAVVFEVCLGLVD